MAVTFREKFKSRRTLVGANPSTETIHIADVVGETDEDLAIKAEAILTLPDTYDSKPRQSLEIEELGPDIWQVTTVYAYTFSTFVYKTDDSASSFDTTGGTRHITQSLRTISRHAPGNLVAPDYSGAIGVSENAIEGVDIIDRKYQFRETRYKAASVVDGAYKSVIYGLSSFVNSTVFMGFQPGEVLFLGATGTQRGETDWEIVYHFIASPNATGLSIGDISDIDKKGWEYLWARYAEQVDDAAQALVQSPISAYVEEVYKTGNLGLLDL